MAHVGAHVGHTRVTRGAHVVAFIKERTEEREKDKEKKGQGRSLLSYIMAYGGVHKYIDISYPQQNR